MLKVLTNLSTAKKLSVRVSKPQPATTTKAPPTQISSTHPAQLVCIAPQVLNPKQATLPPITKWALLFFVRKAHSDRTLQARKKKIVGSVQLATFAPNSPLHHLSVRKAITVLKDQNRCKLALLVLLVQGKV